MPLYNRPRVAIHQSTHANNGAKVSGHEVPKKLKQNINTVRMEQVMMSPLKWGTITHLCMGNFRLLPASLVY